MTTTTTRIKYSPRLLGTPEGSTNQGGWQLAGGHYYKFFSREMLSWQDANAFCRSYGGDQATLAVMPNKAAFDLVQSMAAPAGYVQGANVSADISASSLNVWVGLSDLYDERGTSAQTGKTLPKSHNLAQS